MKILAFLFVFLPLAAHAEFVPIKGLQLRGDADAQGHTINNLYSNFVDQIGAARTTNVYSKADVDAKTNAVTTNLTAAIAAAVAPLSTGKYDKAEALAALANKADSTNVLSVSGGHIEGNLTQGQFGDGPLVRLLGSNIVVSPTSAGGANTLHIGFVGTNPTIGVIQQFATNPGNAALTLNQDVRVVRDLRVGRNVISTSLYTRAEVDALIWAAENEDFTVGDETGIRTFRLVDFGATPIGVTNTRTRGWSGNIAGTDYYYIAASNAATWSFEYITGMYAKVVWSGGTLVAPVIGNGISPGNDNPFFGAVSGERWIRLDYVEASGYTHPWANVHFATPAQTYTMPTGGVGQATVEVAARYATYGQQGMRAEAWFWLSWSNGVYQVLTNTQTHAGNTNAHFARVTPEILPHTGNTARLYLFSNWSTSTAPYSAAWPLTNLTAEVKVSGNKNLVVTE